MLKGSSNDIVSLVQLGQIAKRSNATKTHHQLFATEDGCTELSCVFVGAESACYTELSQLKIPVLSLSYSWLLCTSWNGEDLALLVPEEVSSIESADS